MFNSIRGRVAGRAGDSLFLEAGAVEWDLTMPAIDMGRLPGAGEEARVFTWLYHKEDGMKLYGFADEQRRATFLELLKVEGIGPKGAVRIMGGIGQEELERALEAEDLSRLEAVPGLGKKTAQKMILALKGKLARAVPPGSVPKGPHADLVEALAAMGYDRRLAAAAIAEAEAVLPASTRAADREQQIFRQAIVRLSSNG